MYHTWHGRRKGLPCIHEALHTYFDAMYYTWHFLWIYVKFWTTETKSVQSWDRAPGSTRKARIHSKTHWCTFSHLCYKIRAAGLRMHMIGGVCWLTFEPTIEGRVHKRSAGGNKAATSVISPRISMSLWWGPLTTQLTSLFVFLPPGLVLDDIYGEPGWSKSSDKYLLVLQIMVAGMNQSGWEPGGSLHSIASAMSLLNHFSLTISMWHVWYVYVGVCT